MENYIAFEHITQTHLLILAEYVKKKHSVTKQARNCGMKLPIYKRELSIALSLAGGLHSGFTKGQNRVGVEHFFSRWYGEGHKPAPEPVSAPTDLPPPRIRACNLPILHDSELSPRQMECLRQYVTQTNVIRAAEAMGITKFKFMNEVSKAFYRAAIVCKCSHPLSIMARSKSELVALAYEYFDTLDAPQVTMDDPMF